MREVVLDCETTGLEPGSDRIVEIGLVEVVDLIPTGRHFHTYINPLMKVSPGALKVHGLTDVFLKKQKTLDQVSGYIVDFLKRDPIVAHNAPFDMGFLQAAMRALDMPPLPNQVVDTLALSRTVKSGGKHTLDIMCKHFGVDLSRRTRSGKHGALIDAQILADLYIHLRGGKQFGMDLFGGGKRSTAESAPIERPIRSFAGPTERELAAHGAFIDTIPHAVWRQYMPIPAEDMEVRYLLAG